MPIVHLPLPKQSHDIVISAGGLARLGILARPLVRTARALVICDAAIEGSLGRIAVESLEREGFRVDRVSIVADEREKTLGTTQRLLEACAVAGLDRGSAVIGVGGGLTGDVAGFTAATYMRGVSTILVPTTLLAMVDASIGGKTAVNLRLASGELIKNMVGAFWQPRLVLSDPSTLVTLPSRELRCGLAECVKHAMIADATLMDFMFQELDAIRALSGATIERLIERCAAIKAAIVLEDPTEQGRRAVLNLGHTFAHAIEPIEELDLKHGEAVAIGLCAAMRCACDLQLFSQRNESHVRELLERIGLPTRLSRPMSIERLLAAMTKDKKALDGRLRLILPRDIGQVEIIDDVPTDRVIAAWTAVGA